MFEFTTFGNAKLDRFAVALCIAPRQHHETVDAFVARLREAVREQPDRASALVDAAILCLLWEIEQPTAS